MRTRHNYTLIQYYHPSNLPTQCLGVAGKICFTERSVDILEDVLVDIDWLMGRNTICRSMIVDDRIDFIDSVSILFVSILFEI